MELMVNLFGSAHSISRVPADKTQAYQMLCKHDADIRQLMRDQLEALPAVIHYLDKEMAMPIMKRDKLKNYLGLASCSGPFYEDHYLDNGVRKVF